MKEIVDEDAHRVNSSPEVEMEFWPALFNSFPALSEILPWKSLRGVTEPSLPKRLIRSQHLFGENYVFLKREEDELHVIHEPSAKKLEFLAAQPELIEAKRWLLTADAGSQFAEAVAKLAQDEGKPLRVILRRAPLDERGLHLAMAMEKLGAKVTFASSDRAFRWSLFWQRLWMRFTGGFEIPEEGVSTQASLGYASVFFDLEGQINAGLMPPIDRLYFPVRSGTALAGVLAGQKLSNLKDVKVIGVLLGDEDPQIKHQVVEMANEALEIIGQGKAVAAVTESDFEIDPSVLRFRPLRDEAERWVIRFLELEPMPLDKEGTCLGLLALHRAIERQSIRNQKILYWSDSCDFRQGDLGDFKGYLNLSPKLKKWVQEDLREGRLPIVGHLS